MEKYLAVGLIRIFDIFTQEALTAQFDSFKVQFSLLERKNAENEAKIGLLESKNAENEAKIRGQAEEINQLKAKIDAKFDSDQRLPSADHNNKMKSIYREENSIGQSSTRAIAPASCRELSLIGHSLDGLYLVRNPDTNKIETVLCDFGTTSKFDFFYLICFRNITIKLYY